MLEIISNSNETKQLIMENVKKYDQLSLADQGVLGRQVVVCDTQKTKLLEVFRDNMRNMQIELNAYEQKLGRKLTDEELSNYLSGQKLSTVVDDVDLKLLKRIEAHQKAQQKTILPLKK